MTDSTNRHGERSTLSEPGRSVLLVEDDARVRVSLGLALGDEGFEVLSAGSGEQAMALLESRSVDVVLLDLMLPGVDGLSVCRALRSRGDLPIIIITARSDTPSVIEGLEAGADDYVTKPLIAVELAARIRALQRRRRPGGSETARFPVRVGDLDIVPAEGVVRRAGVDIHLTRTEFRLLEELAGAEGCVVSRETLLNRVWGYDYYGDTRLLDVHMNRLRRKIELSPEEPSVVLTVRGVGYKVRRA
jgi:DNA-binding response OmpR family regulator